MVDVLELEWALESCCLTGPSGQIANCCYVVPIVDCLSQATCLWWRWIFSEQGAVVEVKASAQRRSQERQLAAGRESLKKKWWSLMAGRLTMHPFMVQF